MILLPKRECKLNFHRVKSRVSLTGKEVLFYWSQNCCRKWHDINIIRHVKFVPNIKDYRQANSQS